MHFVIFWDDIEPSARIYRKQALHDITGQLQVRHMLYTLYFDINVQVVKMLQTY